MKENYPKLGAVLKRLLFQKDIRGADLARAVDLPLPTIHRLLTGKSTRPYQSSIKPIADYFGITPEQLLGVQPLFPDEKLDKPAKAAATAFQLIPIWSWQDLSEASPKAEQTLAVGNMSADAFALIMPDFSMEPLFEKGCTLIFDPQVKPVDRSYVLLKTANTYVFRQLLVDAEHQYIKSLNPDISATSMRLLGDDDRIMACLVETRSHFQII
jgi:transcriptional regulator with XRE-family HTH domain